MIFCVLIHDLLALLDIGNKFAVKFVIALAEIKVFIQSDSWSVFARHYILKLICLS